MKCPYNDFNECFKEECPFYYTIEYTHSADEHCRRAENETKPTLPHTNTITVSEACRYCPNHPSNGGSGICHCMLGNRSWTC